MWGYPLGSKCMAVRQKEVYVKNNPERHRELEKLGFLMKGNSALGWLEVVHAAAIYSKLHRRQLDVPQKFVVPHPPVNTHDEKTPMDRNVSEIVDAWPWPGTSIIPFFPSMDVTAFSYILCAWFLSIIGLWCSRAIVGVSLRTETEGCASKRKVLDWFNSWFTTSTAGWIGL
jgi:hypothetical protein